MLNEKEWQDMFAAELALDPNASHPVIVMKIIQNSLHIDDSSTMQELLGRMESVRTALSNIPQASSSFDSAGDIFTKFITQPTSLIENAKSLDEVRGILTVRGEDFLEAAKIMHVKVGQRAMTVFQRHPNPEIITHSWNLCVLQACKEAVQRGYCFKVYVTEGLPHADGDRMVQDLRTVGVTAEKISFMSVSHYLSKSTCVMVGAESVASNRGVVAKMGTGTLTAVASALEKPTYVLAECFRLDEDLKPLQGRSLPSKVLYGPAVRTMQENELPRVDYTPSRHVTKLITDVGNIEDDNIEDYMEELYT